MMSLLALRQHLTRRLETSSAPHDDRGAAMVSTVLFMILLGGISVVLLAVLVGQIAPSLASQQSARAGYTAQAGLQVGLGAIRAALAAPDPAGVVYGDRSALPCTVDGAADGAAGELPFDVEIRYFTLDPSGQDDAWLDANDLTCVPGAGVPTQPRYALVISGGTSLNTANEVYDRDRTIAAMYEFNLTNVNIPGGRILNGARTHCLRADSSASNAQLRFFELANCTNDELELWIYDTDWKIKLANTTEVGNTPLCITGPVAPGNGNAPIPTNVTQNAVLRPCLGPTDPNRWNQLWSWEGSQNWRGQRQNITGGISSYCLSPPAAPVTGGNLIARHNGCSSTMSPTADVGAGAAGYGTQQIVSFKQFGRCADVTNEVITFAYMMAYPCKQDPTGTGNGILWNHKWIYQEPAELNGSLAGQEIWVYTSNAATTYRCLTTQPNTSSNRYPVFQVCSGIDRQKWTRVAQAETYENSWLFIDTYGRCMSIDETDLHSGQYAKMVTVDCNGTEEQKWNAPPNSTSATFGGFREVAN